MENLIIKNNTSRVIRKAVAVIFFINGILWILGHIGEWKIYHWVFGITFIFLSIAYFTDMFGTEISYMHSGSDYIKIKWINRIRPVIIRDTDIKILVLTRSKVVIELNGKKPLNLPVDFFEMEQKKDVYEYFIEYARNKNLELIREF